MASFPGCCCPCLPVSLFPHAIPSERGERKPPAPKGSLKAIITHPAVVTFFLMNFLQVSHGAYYTFFSIHLEQHGYGKLSIGLLWSLGVLAEIGLFW